MKREQNRPEANSATSPAPWETFKEVRGEKRQYSTESWDTVAFSYLKNSGLKEDLTSCGNLKKK